MSSNNQLCNNHFRVEWGGNRVGNGRGDAW